MPQHSLRLTLVCSGLQWSGLIQVDLCSYLAESQKVKIFKLLLHNFLQKQTVELLKMLFFLDFVTNFLNVYITAGIQVTCHNSPAKCWGL